MTSRDWIPGVSVELHVARQDDSFVVTSSGATNYIYELDDLVLKIYKVKPSEKVLAETVKKLGVGPAIYPYIQHTINQVHIPNDVTHFVTPNLFANNIPSRVVYLLLTQGQLLGKKKELPCVLEPHGLEKVGNNKPVVQYSNLTHLSF